MGRVIDIRRYMGAKGGSGLPYDAEVEYLQSDGTQWIELGIYGSNDLDFTIDFEPLDLTETNRTWTGTGSYFGVRAGYNYELSGYNRSTTLKGCFFFYTYSDASGYTKTVGLTSTRQTVSKRGTNLIRPDGSSASLQNGTVEYTTTQTIVAYAKKTSSGNVSTFGKMKLYSLKFEKNNETILDLVPVRKGQVGYLYDKISGTLFGNSGTGNFILGQDVTRGG